MTDASIARLTALLAIDPRDTAACNELRHAKQRAGILTPHEEMVEVDQRDLNDANLLPGWEWFFALIDSGEGGEAWFAAPSAEVAAEWAIAWTQDGSWDVVRGTAELKVGPAMRDEDGCLDLGSTFSGHGWDEHQIEEFEVRVGYGWDDDE